MSSKHNKGNNSKNNNKTPPRQPKGGQGPPGEWSPYDDAPGVLLTPKQPGQEPDLMLTEEEIVIPRAEHDAKALP